MSAGVVSKRDSTRLMILSLIVALSGIAFGSCSAGGDGAVATTCIPASAFDALSADKQSFDGGLRGPGWVQVWKSASVHVTRGTFVGLELVQPEYPAGYVSARAGFPWTRPKLSASKVLKSARQCRKTPQSVGLQVLTYYFQGVATGTVTATVPLSDGWRVQSTKACEDVRLSCTLLTPLRVTVTVS